MLLKIKISNKRTVLLFFALTLLLLTCLGEIKLFDWDEANFAEIAREMMLTNNYLQPQINYLPFYEKPPLFIWFQVVSMKLFGINEFAARFPNALLGVINAVILYRIGKRDENEKFGRLWALIYMGSLLPFMYFRTGLIDPWFNFFMFLSLYFYYKMIASNGKAFLVLFSSVFLGLAVMTKGPVALLIVGGTIGLYKLFSGTLFKLILQNIVWILLSCTIGSIWFMIETKAHGVEFVKEFIIYQIRLLTTEDALHGGPFYYHFLVLLIGCFPASFLLFNKKNIKDTWQEPFGKLMILCGAFVLILFTIVQTKIIHYSSMAYYPITYLAAKYLYTYELKKSIKWSMVIVTCLLILILLLIPILGVNLEFFKSFISDQQTLAQLSYPVKWSYTLLGYGVIVSITFLLLCFYSKSKKYVSFVLTPLIVFVLMSVYAPKIERYVQGSYIDFCENKKGLNLDIVPLYIKSYAVYFYQDKKPFKNKIKTIKEYFHSKSDRKLYFFSRTKDTTRFTVLKNSINTYGFHFFEKVK